MDLEGRKGVKKTTGTRNRMEEQERAKASALRLLSRRSHSRKELSRRLVEKGFEEDDIEDVIDELERIGLQSDEEFASMFARSKWRQSTWGPQRISMVCFQQ